MRLPNDLGDGRIYLGMDGKSDKQFLNELSFSISGVPSLFCGGDPKTPKWNCKWNLGTSTKVHDMEPQKLQRCKMIG